MTKAERNTIQKFFNRYGELTKVSDDFFKDLQNLSKKAGLDVWCNAEANYEQLRGTQYEKTAKRCFDEYTRAEAQKDLIMDFGSSLSSIGFWK